MKIGERVNFHTHTVRCKHASGTVREYCESAQALGLMTLGMSDHAPFPDGRYSDSRMEYAELAEYRQEVEDARNAYHDLTVYAGMEVDIDPEYGWRLVDEVFFGKLRFDYLIGGVHMVEARDPEDALWSNTPVISAKTAMAFIEANTRLIESDRFLYLAHPDLWACKFDDWTPEIEAGCTRLIQTAIRHDCPLEINAYGPRKPWKTGKDVPPRPQYPWLPFWKLAAKLGAKTVVGADAHTPEDVWSNAEQLFDFARTLGLNPINAELPGRVRAKAGR